MPVTQAVCEICMMICEITIGDDTNKALVQKLQMKAAMIGFETTMLLRSHPVIAISSLEFMHLIIIFIEQCLF